MSSKFLDKTGLDTLWAKIKSTFRTIPQDVSKGANLVVNGSGRMASNYNFTSFLYVPTISYGGSAGSFGYNGTGEENEYISCDFNKKVVFSADVKNLVAQPSNCIHRLYVLEFDIDKKSIKAIHVMYGVGTLTELTQDLNPGDTVVHLADLSNANWLSTTTYHRGFIFWNYQNSYGYLYPPETYSRNVYPLADSNSLWDVANVNVSAGTITLNSGWTGPAIPSGTKVSRRSSGNMYPYPTSVTTGDTEWHSMKGYMKGVTSPGTSERSSTKFSQGTAFIRAGIYPSNLNNADPVINKRAVVANFAIYEEQDINDGFGTLPVNRGGTGKTSVTAGNYLVGNGTNDLTEKTPNVAANDLINALTTAGSTPTDNDYYVAQYAGGGTTTKTFHRLPVKALWEYIKEKISSVLGLTATDYGGNAATAAGYTNGGAIAAALAAKADSSSLATVATSGSYSDLSNTPTVSRYFNKYSGGTSVYGWKIGSTVTGNVDGVSSVITGVFTLALGINPDYAPQESTTVKTKATMVGFFSCYARRENGADVIKARIYTPVSSINDSTFNLKYIDEGNGKITWVLGFGTGTTPESKAYVYCSVNVMSSFNADFGNFGDAITSSPTYGSYFTVFKSPYIPQNTSGIGSTTRPVYVNENGKVTECSNYGGGTAVTLNGSSKAASTASFYAPTAVGTAGKVLKSSGSGAPTWGDAVKYVTSIDTSTMESDVLYVM